MEPKNVDCKEGTATMNGMKIRLHITVGLLYAMVENGIKGGSLPIDAPVVL